MHMQKVAPDRGHETESLIVVRDKDGRAAGMDVGGEVHGAVAKDVEEQTERKRSVEALQCSARRRFVRWRDAIKDGRSNRKETWTTVAS